MKIKNKLLNGISEHNAREYEKETQLHAQNMKKHIRNQQLVFHVFFNHSIAAPSSSTNRSFAPVKINHHASLHWQNIMH